MRYFEKHPIISNQIDETDLKVIIRELRRVLKTGVQGDVVEFGCYEGTTSLFLSRELVDTSKELYLYDSFKGLPEKTTEDMSIAGEQFKAGELRTSFNTLRYNFKKAGLDLPVVVQGWFDEISDDDIPSQIAFAFLDGDFYSSIMVSLECVWGKLTPGATVVVDDYKRDALPGVTRALSDWQKSHDCIVLHEASLAIIKKQ